MRVMSPCGCVFFARGEGGEEVLFVFNIFVFFIFVFQREGGGEVFLVRRGEWQICCVRAVR